MYHAFFERDRGAESVAYTCTTTIVLIQSVCCECPGGPAWATKSHGAYIETDYGIIRMMVTTLKARRHDRLGDIEG